MSEIPLLLFFASELDDGGTDPAQARVVLADHRRLCLEHLLFEDELLHHGPATAATLAGPGEPDIALLPYGFPPLDHLFQTSTVAGWTVFGEEGAHLLAERLFF